MKKILALTFIMTLCMASYVFAQTNQNITIGKDEIKNTTVFKAGQSVVNSGTINDDMFAAGQSVINDGIVNGDVFAAGQSLVVDGTVNGNIRAAGQDIDIRGTVARNVSIAGNNVIFDRASSIRGTAMAAGNFLKVDGTINKSLYAAGANVIISGTINGDAYINAESITISPGSNIKGSLTYTSSNDANITPGTVVGKVSKITPTVSPVQPPKTGLTGSDILFKIIFLIGTFLLGIIFIKLFERFFDSAPDTIKSKWLQYLGIGFAALIMIPVGFIILLITVIGVPIAFAALLAYLLLIMFAKIPVSVFIGDILLKGEKGIYLKLLLGLAVLAVISLIPIIGWLISFIVFLIGSGLVIYKVIYKSDKVNAKELN